MYSKINTFYKHINCIGYCKQMVFVFCVKISDRISGSHLYIFLNVMIIKLHQIRPLES